MGFNCNHPPFRANELGKNYSAVADTSANVDHNITFFQNVVVTPLIQYRLTYRLERKRMQLGCHKLSFATAIVQSPSSSLYI